jgi:ABC-type lipoprotein release transport system permease subunit
VDPPEGFSWTQWNNRGKQWDKILDRCEKSSFHYSIVENLSPMFTFDIYKIKRQITDDDLIKNLPSLEKRIYKISKHLTLQSNHDRKSEEAKNIMIGRDYAAEYLEVMHTIEKGTNEDFIRHKKEVESTIKKDLTINDFKNENKEKLNG